MSSTVPEIQDRSILITGGAGFIGSHLVDRLVPENDVRILDDLSNASGYEIPEGVDLIEADVRDTEALETAMTGVDTVLHKAAIVSVSESIKDPIESQSVNVDGTLAVLEMARRKDVRVVFASSTAIYGEPNSLPIKESHPKDPQSPYGAQKLSGDMYVGLYSDIYDLETVTLRYFNVYGPRQSSGLYGGVISIFADQALAGESLTVHGDGLQTRDFVHIDDIVQANLRAMTTDQTGRSFNVGTGTEVSIIELAEMIRDISSSESRIVHEDSRSGDVDRSRADITRISEELGFEPTVRLKQGLRNLVEWRQ